MTDPATESLREEIDAAAIRAADESWGSAESGKGMMQNAVAAAVGAILPIIEADFEEWRQNTVICGDCGTVARAGCDYLGHGLVGLSELLESWGNPEDRFTDAQRSEEKARLVGEFRRLADEAQRRSEQHVQHANQSGALSAMGKATVWREAAQMLEESKP